MRVSTYARCRWFLSQVATEGGALLLAGAIVTGQLLLTPMGRAVLAALKNVPSGSNGSVTFHALTISAARRLRSALMSAEYRGRSEDLHCGRRL